MMRAEDGGDTIAASSVTTVTRMVTSCTSTYVMVKDVK